MVIKVSATLPSHLCHVSDCDEHATTSRDAVASNPLPRIQPELAALFTLFRCFIMSIPYFVCGLLVALTLKPNSGTSSAQWRTFVSERARRQSTPSVPKPFYLLGPTTCLHSLIVCLVVSSRLLTSVSLYLALRRDRSVSLHLAFVCRFCRRGAPASAALYCCTRSFLLLRQSAHQRHVLCGDCEQTETCFYTEMKIWPGKGRRFIRRDGRVSNRSHSYTAGTALARIRRPTTQHSLTALPPTLFLLLRVQFLAFIDQKSRSLYDQKIKAQRLTWTQAWRRRNKKGRVETAAKKKGKKTARVFKSIAGITIEDIKKRRDAKPDLRKAQRETALREIKEKAKKAAEDKKKAAAYNKKQGGAVAGGGEFAKVPKQRRQAGKQAVKSTQR